VKARDAKRKDRIGDGQKRDDFVRLHDIHQNDVMNIAPDFVVPVINFKIKEVNKKDLDEDQPDDFVSL